MRKLLFLFFLMICSIGIYLDEHKNAFADNQTSSIRNAMVRFLCFEVYWERSDYKLGTTFPMKIDIDKNNFQIWINDLKVNKRAHVAGFFTGRLRNGEAAVIGHEAYNIKLTPPVIGYIENKAMFDSKDVIEDTLTVPSDCTPHYDPTTPKKELMLRTVISTVQKELSSWVRQGIAKYPREITVIIADFNVDYSYTYVLVKQTNDVFSVALHDFQEYDSDEYERDGEYPFGTIYNTSKSLLEEIRKHGIVRKIKVEN